MISVPDEVLEAFNCAGVPKNLIGGEGNSFVAAGIVFKPVYNIARYEWACGVLLKTSQNGFRVSLPRKSSIDRFSHAGWGATAYLPGKHKPGLWKEKLEVCRAFHEALRHVTASPMPPSDDRWSLAHEIAWGEREFTVTLLPEIRRKIEAIFGKYQTIDVVNQIIHSDLCGNILFNEPLDPLVIDFSPAFRPKEYGEAILVADAIAWGNAPQEFRKELPETPFTDQMLLRAINFRLIVTAIFNPKDGAMFDKEFNAYLPLLNYVLKKDFS